MSFSSDVKKEMCTAPLSRPCDMIAESYAMLLFSAAFSTTGIRLSTGNEAIAARIAALFLRAFSLRLSCAHGESGLYTYTINDETALHSVFDAFGLSGSGLGMRLNRALLEEDCCRSAFLRGAFLCGGSVADPLSRYHLELVTPHYTLSRELTALLMDMEFTPKITTRKSNYIIYFKYSEAIEDFLTKSGAPISAMTIMQTKVEKEVRNNVNRKVNCETANIDRTVNASAAQLTAIRQLRETGRLDALPRELAEAARLRLEYPDHSLSALAALCDPPLSRAALHYRFQKLMDLVNGRT